MTKILAITTQKGGAGKSTLATNLACWLTQKQGATTLLVSNDPQGTAVDWAAVRNDETVPTISLGMNIGRELQRKARRFDWVVIDGAPQAGGLAAETIKVADFVLIPTLPNAADIWASEAIVEIIKARQAATGGQPKAAFVLSMVDSRTRAARECDDALAGYGLPIFTARTSRLTAYADAMMLGSSTSDLSENNRAAQQIDAIGRELLEFSS